MFQIQNLTTDPKQKQNIVLPDGTQIILEIAFVPMQLGWFIRELTHVDFSISGIRICNSPDILYQYRNQIPFGLACFSPITKREPTQQEDFVSESSTLYILTQEEVAEYTNLLNTAPVI